jgi:hypothetical protein
VDGKEVPSNLKMEAVDSTEMMADMYKFTRRLIPEDCNLDIHVLRTSKLYMK